MLKNRISNAVLQFSCGFFQNFENFSGVYWWPPPPTMSTPKVIPMYQYPRGASGNEDFSTILLFFNKIYIFYWSNFKAFIIAGLPPPNPLQMRPSSCNHVNELNTVFVPNLNISSNPPPPPRTQNQNSCISIDFLNCTMYKMHD